MKGAVGLTPFFKGGRNASSLSPTSHRASQEKDTTTPVYSHLEFCKNKVNQKKLGNSLLKDVIIS